MAELADAADSKSADLRVLGVRLPLPAPGSKPDRDLIYPIPWQQLFLGFVVLSALSNNDGRSREMGSCTVRGVALAMILYFGT